MRNRPDQPAVAALLGRPRRGPLPRPAPGLRRRRLILARTHQMKLIHPVLAVLAAAALAGCTTPSEDDNAANGPPLLNTEWQMVRFQPPAGAAPIVPGHDETYTLQLNADGRAVM